MQYLSLAIVVLMCVYHINAGIYQPGRQYPMKPQYVAQANQYQQPSYDSGSSQDVYQEVQYPKYQSNYKKKSIYGMIKQYRQPSQYIQEYQPQVQQYQPSGSYGVKYQPSEAYDMNQYSGPSY
jgi:hypothetical protein